MAIPFPRSGATGSLDRFGVSIDQDQGQGPLLQPKYKYRFRVLFFGFGGDGRAGEPLTLNTNTLTLPTLSHEEIQVHSYNSRAYFAGKHEWSTMSLTVRDTYDNTVTREVGRQLQRQLDHYNQTGFRAGADYKFKMVVQQLDGGHDTTTENWFMEGCYLSNVEYGDMDYSASEARTIQMTVRPDNVILEGEGSGGENTVFTDPGADPLGTTINR